MMTAAERRQGQASPQGAPQDRLAQIRAEAAAEEEAANASTESEEEEEDEGGVDPASVALKYLRLLMKVINEEVTVEWGKNGLIRQKIEHAVKTMRTHGKKALHELKALAAGRGEDDEQPPYMEMVDVDDLKAACNVYEKQLAMEAVRARRSEKELVAMTKNFEAAKHMIKELSQLKLVIAQIEVSNEDLEKKATKEKTERIAGAGREYRLEQEVSELKKHVNECREELQRMAKEQGTGKPGYGAGASMAEAYAEEQARELAQLRKQIAQQKEEMDVKQQVIEDRNLEIQSLYYSFHRPQPEGYGVIT
jgi:hypothetical protein